MSHITEKPMRQKLPGPCWRGDLARAAGQPKTRKMPLTRTISLFVKFDLATGFLCGRCCNWSPGFGGGRRRICPPGRPNQKKSCNMM
jgi:hypothetical protein